MATEATSMATENTSESTKYTNIIESTAKSGDVGAGYGFRSYNYVKTAVKMTPDSAKEETNCLDSGFGSSLIDRKFLARTIPDATIGNMSEPRMTSATTNHVLRSESLCKGLASLKLYPTAEDIPFGGLNYSRKLPLPKEKLGNLGHLIVKVVQSALARFSFSVFSGHRSSHGEPHPLHALQGALADRYAYCSKRKASHGSGEESKPPARLWSTENGRRPNAATHRGQARNEIFPVGLAEAEYKELLSSVIFFHLLFFLSNISLIICVR